MTDRNTLTFTGRLRSVKFAVHGIRIMLGSQQNAWIHAVATVVVIAAGFILQLDCPDLAMLRHMVYLDLPLPQYRKIIAMNVAALNHAGVANDFTYVSTAGGAFLEWMEGRTLPGVAALEQ